MKKIAIVLALMLIIGAVFISGCTTTQNNTQNTSGNAQNKSSGIPGYSIGQIVSIESGNSEFSAELSEYNWK